MAWDKVSEHYPAPIISIPLSYPQTTIKDYVRMPLSLNKLVTWQNGPRKKNGTLNNQLLTIWECSGLLGKGGSS